jgi:site-specific DNA-methyltransferase (adenine-specific)
MEGLQTGEAAMKRLDFTNKVFNEEASKLLAALPTASIDSVIADPMYGVTRDPKPKRYYGWGPDPCRGDPDRWAALHLPTYRHCLRVLKPGGKLAWAMGSKFRDHFPAWFGGYRIWCLRLQAKGRNLDPFGHIWLVQTREREPVRFPDADAFVELRTSPQLLRLHPCPKALTEMRFLVEHLSQPGDIILDPFCGIGSTLVAAAQLGRRYVGCDLWPDYCRVAMWRLRELNA